MMSNVPIQSMFGQVAVNMSAELACNFEECLEKFQCPWQLIVHHQKCHDSDNAYFCCCWKDCSKSFSRPDLACHHYQRHTGNKPHACGQCLKQFYTSGELATHNHWVHNRGRHHPCPIESCCRYFAELNQAKEHAKKHIYKCSIPDCAQAAFVCKTSLEKHVSQKHVSIPVLQKANK